MSFIEFCMANGIIIDKPPRIGVWERYPTETHPRKRNGAVKWMVDYGFCQDHAVHTEIQFWRADAPIKIDSRLIQKTISEADTERRKLQENAAMRASMIMSRCLFGRHDYLSMKGFPDEKGAIWCHDKTEHLVVPMYEDSRLIGLQTIDRDGGKKFLYGQKTGGASLTIGREGTDVLCEGYATGLSIRAAMLALKNQWRIHVCFSAGNLGKIASRLRSGFVVADNDESGTGERVARKTGFNFWMSDQKGEDFNDYHRRAGLFAASQSLFKSMHQVRGNHTGNTDTFRQAIEARKLSHQGHT